MTNELSALAATKMLAEALDIGLANIRPASVSGALQRTLHGAFAGSAAVLAGLQLEHNYGVDTDVPYFYEYGDLDLFMFNPAKDPSHMARAEERLHAAGFWLDGERMQKMSRRVDIQGQPRWVTNSIKMTNGMFDVNLINKTVNGNVMLDVFDVLKTFDWPWLTTDCWDLASGGRARLFPMFTEFFQSRGEEFVLLNSRLQDFKDGMMSQHIMLRQMPRLAKYIQRMDDTLLWADGAMPWLQELRDEADKTVVVMMDAYDQYAQFMWDRGTKDSTLLGDVAAAYVRAASVGEWSKINSIADRFGTSDALDRILDELL